MEGDYLAHGIDHEEAEKVLVRISKNGVLNARQAIEAAKEAFSGGVSPVFPPDVDTEGCDKVILENDVTEERLRNQSTWTKLVFEDDRGKNENHASYLSKPRESICTYTDGGLKDPKNKWLATAGFGIWAPGISKL